MKLSEVDKSLVDKMWHQTGPASLGGDPEYFIANSRGKILNSDAFFPGKNDPVLVKARGLMQSKLFFDGIQAEIAIAHNTCREYLVDNIRNCWNVILETVPVDHKIILKPSAKIQKSILEIADPEARRFGCAPDFNAYTKTINTPEMDASRHPFRYAGGHLHIGVPDMKYRKPGDPYMKLACDESRHLRVIKCMDILVTIPTLLLDNSQAAKRRRSKYGKAGCFRPTPYGVEYRTPSCWWLKSPLTMSLIYGLARMAWTLVGCDLDIELLKAIKTDEDTIRGCIDESDEKTVKNLWKDLRPYVALMGFPISNPLNIGSYRTTKSDYPTERYKGYTRTKLKGKPVYSLAVFEYMLENGIESVVENDIRSEWGIGSVGYNGLLNGGYSKLLHNNDFGKFQENFLTHFFN
jgi:hypothetical protein